MLNLASDPKEHFNLGLHITQNHICIREIVNNCFLIMYVVQYQQQSNLAFNLFVKSQHTDLQISLDELMSYSLTPVPPSLGTADGFCYKTNKAALLPAILDDVTDNIAYPDDALSIQYGNVHFHSLIDILPYIW